MYTYAHICENFDVHIKWFRFEPFVPVVFQQQKDGREIILIMIKGAGDDEDISEINESQFELEYRIPFMFWPWWWEN